MAKVHSPEEAAKKLQEKKRYNPPTIRMLKQADTLDDAFAHLKLLIDKHAKQGRDQ